MQSNTLQKYDLQAVLEAVSNEIDAVYVIDAEEDTYVALKDNAMFEDLFQKNGSYLELSRILMFHFSDSAKNIVPEYHVFLPKLNKFNGKYSRRIKIFYHESPVIIQMSIYPLDTPDNYVLFLTEMDNCEYMQEFFTQEKENNIQSSYLFTMHVDLTNDLCNSVSVAEMSDDPMNYTGLQYSQWRMMIVNMIYPDDQPMFLTYTDPEYIRAHLETRRSTSIDCQMQNLVGKFIWVKLIFNKIETKHKGDFRFVFMVQDIHETHMKLISDLKRYEELSNIDSLTGVFNHGKIENELYHCMEQRSQDGTPLCLLMLDVDYFKKVNDTFGHATGDIVLKELVSLASTQFAPHDITFGRWGGEEFIGICTTRSQTELAGIAEALRTAVEAHDFAAAGRVTCSIGIISVADEETPEEAFARVDQALYDAKKAGRNRIVCG